MSDLKARLALLSASVVAWLLSFLSSAQATRPSRQRATTFVIHILSVSKSSCCSLCKRNKRQISGLTSLNLSWLLEVYNKTVY